MFCKKCGNEIEDNAKFCNHCGSKVKKEKENNGKGMTKKTYLILGGSLLVVLGLGATFYTNQMNVTKELKRYESNLLDKQMMQRHMISSDTEKEDFASLCALYEKAIEDKDLDSLKQMERKLDQFLEEMNSKNSEMFEVSKLEDIPETSEQNEEYLENLKTELERSNKKGYFDESEKIVEQYNKKIAKIKKEDEKAKSKMEEAKQVATQNNHLQKEETSSSYANPEKTHYNGYYRWADQYLDEDFIRYNMGDFDIQLAINEFHAKYGLKFQNKESSFDVNWYQYFKEESGGVYEGIYEASQFQNKIESAIKNSGDSYVYNTLVREREDRKSYGAWSDPWWIRKNQ